jgi:hypothetical protein
VPGSTRKRRRWPTATTRSFRAPGRGWAATPRRGSRRSTSGSRRSAPRSARTSSPTRRTSCSFSRRPTISPACRFRRHRRGGSGGRAQPARQARHHPVALLDRAVPDLFHPPRPARQGLRGLDEARRIRRGERQPGADFRDHGAAGPSAPGSWAIAVLPISSWPTRWRRPPAPSRRCSPRSGNRQSDGLPTEHAALQRMASLEGSNEPVSAADWRHYAEKVRKAEFDFDEAELKPYLQLDSMIAAAFDTANRLFGLGFEEISGLDLYHPDVRVWRVTGREWPAGRHLPRRLFRPHQQAERGVDVGASHATPAGWRRAAGDRQCHEFRQGAQGASRRCSASMTREPCSTNSATRCTGCCPTSPIR